MAVSSWNSPTDLVAAGIERLGSSSSTCFRRDDLLDLEVAAELFLRRLVGVLTVSLNLHSGRHLQLAGRFVCP